MLLILRSKNKAPEQIKKFNRKLASRLKKENIFFEFASFEDVEIFLGNKSVDIKIKNKPLDSWKTIYPRKISIFNSLAHILASETQKRNIFFVDEFHKTKKDSSDANKISQMYHFAVANVPIPKTYCTATYSKKQINNALRFLGLPIVIKKSNTSQGAGVFLANTKHELEKILEKIPDEEKNGNVFLQEFIANDFEYRIFITGDSIGATEKKIRTKKSEFRNNVSLGAREHFIEVVTVKKNIRECAIKAAGVANIQVAGVDIIEHNKRPIVFEVNSCPGITLDERISPELKNLALYLSKCEK